ITLALSQYVLPEDLYPWLNLVAGLLVLVVGALVLRARLRGVPEGHTHGPGGHTHGPGGHTHRPGGAARSHVDHEHAHPDDGAGCNRHDQSPGHDHAQGRDPDHDHDHAHDHVKHDDAPDSLRPRVLLAAGASAGLIPCPSALVVLLAAVAQQKIALGLLLIVTFSVGLAATLTGLGLAVVYARTLTTRWHPRGLIARAFAVIPALSALVIIAVGVVLTARAVPGIA
ncbi:MAG: sulfite exporter TauE/SafE family protein, partial [Actinobacteria bacterium]|nr:sulfite exporter TauE/SafE family protein [Actinomycetota bacterium]